MPPPVRMAESGSRLLIVSADDYGLTEKVSRAILKAHRGGVVTSTSVLALAPAFEQSVRWLGEVPRLGVGVHLAAVGEDPPLLSAAEIPSLVDRRGRLRASWRQFVPLLTGGRIDPADLRREFAAQLERVTAAGVVADHLDTHHDLHRWPSVRDAVLDLAERHQIAAVRMSRSSAHSPSGVAQRRLARVAQRRCRARGLVYPEVSAGNDVPGQLDLPATIRALHRLAVTRAPSAELITHPGGPDDPDRARYAWGYRWDDELASLTSGTVRHAVKEYGFRLGSFADLPGATSRGGRTPETSVRPASQDPTATLDPTGTDTPPGPSAR
jgi:chitin disaccharide deacetylase